MNKKYTLIAAYYWSAQAFLFTAMLMAFTGHSFPTVLLFCMVLILISADWIMVSMFLRLSSELKIEEEIKLRQIKLQNHIHYFKMLQLRNRYIRRLYHDLSNHILTINALAEQGKETEKQNYIASIKKAYQINTDLCSSENINLAAGLYRLNCVDMHTNPVLQLSVSRPITEEYENAVCILFKQLIDAGYDQNVVINDVNVILERPLSVRVDGLQISADNSSETSE